MTQNKSRAVHNNNIHCQQSAQTPSSCMVELWETEWTICCWLQSRMHLLLGQTLLPTLHLLSSEAAYPPLPVWTIDDKLLDSGTRSTEVLTSLQMEISKHPYGKVRQVLGHLHQSIPVTQIIKIRFPYCIFFFRKAFPYCICCADFSKNAEHSMKIPAKRLYFQLELIKSSFCSSKVYL